jgi:TRAP-type C4-dicarboxylate transport system substrate-binding protein
MQSHPFRRRTGLLVACVLAIVAMFAVACGGDDSEESSSSAGAAAEETKHELKFAYFLGEKTTFGQLWTWWMDEVEKRTDGTVTFPDRFWDGTLLKGEEMVDGLNDGRVDVAQITPPMYPGKFPLTTVTELPFASNNVPAGAAAIAKLAQENEALRNEYESKGAIPLAFNIASPSAVGTKKEIKTVADLKGTKLRGIDRQSQLLKKVGANLFNLGPADIYGAVERGLINGFNGIPFAFVGALKFPEIVKNYVDLGMGMTTANALSMSKRTWEKLSERQQQVIREVSAEIPAKLAEVDAQAEDATCEVIKKEGAKISVLPEAEVQKLRDLSEKELVPAWVKEAGGQQAEEFRKVWLETVKAEEANYPDYTLGMHRCMEELGS